MKAPSAVETLALGGAALVGELIEGMLDAVWLVDARTLRVAAGNASAARMLGVPLAWLLGRDVLELCATPEDLVFWDEASAGAAPDIESESWVLRPDGVLVPVTRRVRRLGIDADALLLVVLHDRSEEVRIEHALQARGAELAATLESVADGILVTDLAGGIRGFNRAFAELWELPAPLLRSRDDAAVHEAMRSGVADAAQFAHRHAAGVDVELIEAVDTVTLASGRVLQRVLRPQASGGRVMGHVASYRDISARLDAARQLDALARSDALTGLPNRRALADRCEFSAALARRAGGSFALLFADLDGFERINDTLGRELGDRVLIEVAQRMKAALRQVVVVARLGGDQFALLVHEADARGADSAARRVLAAMQRPFSQGDMTFTLTCSIGIALYPNDGAELEQLVRSARVAMQEVKATGRAAHRFHDASQRGAEVAARQRLRLDSAMRQALVTGHFRLHYQPQVDLASGRVVGAEALIRWRDPELGHVSPAEFIPLAEQSGFIVAIGDWVLCQAVAQAARWRAQGRELVVCVNVSAVQFRRAGFVERVAEVLREAALPAALLELELTESILLEQAHEALLRLQALAQLGVKLAIDDFGTGFSSLGYLKRFPIHRLKIDRSFVCGLPGDTSDAGIVDAIVNLGRALQLQTVAEGVETEAQREFLERTGCNQYQGYLFAPALDAPSFEARVVDFDARVVDEDPAPR